jgi:phosphatidylinositol glycan class M
MHLQVKPNSSSSSGRPQQQQGASAWLLAVLQQGLAFGCPAAALFFLLGLGFYQLYGQGFLHEAFLHHLVRKDPRHSFSMYYYPVYLDFMRWPGTSAAAAAAGAAQDPSIAAAAAEVGDVLVGGLTGISSSSNGGIAAALAAVQRLLPSAAAAAGFDSMWQQLGQLLAALPEVEAGRLAIVPQAVLLLVLAVALHRNQPLCWLLQTMAFVAFNKVCTAQYFVWYYSLLPVALQRMPWPLPKALQVAGVVWVVAQLHWLFWGYMLEFEGAAVHLALWWAGAFFLMANTAFMWVLLGCARLCGKGSGKAVAGDEKLRVE